MKITENFIHIEDLLYYDGPLLSHYKAGGQDWLVVWYDRVPTGTMRFIPELGIEVEVHLYLHHAFPITAENFVKVTAAPSTGNAITLREAMESATAMYRVEDDGLYRDDHELHGELVQFKDIPEDGLPTVGSYVVFESNEAPLTSADSVQPGSPVVA